MRLKDAAEITKTVHLKDVILSQNMLHRYLKG